MGRISSSAGDIKARNYGGGEEYQTVGNNIHPCFPFKVNKRF